MATLSVNGKLLKIDLKKALLKIFGAAAELVSLTPDPAKAAVRLAEIAEAITCEDTSETKLATLLVKTHVRTVAALIEEIKFDWKAINHEKVAELLDTATAKLLAGPDISITTSDLFARAHAVPVVRNLAQRMADWARDIGVSEDQAARFANSYPIFFEEQLHEELLAAHDKGSYATLLALPDLPTRQAGKARRLWARYRRARMEDLDKGLFGTPATLRQVYVPPRGRQQLRPVSQPMARAVPEEIWSFISDVEGELLAWLGREAREDTVRLITGGPGSGKSSLAKKLAARLAETPDWNVLLLPLDRLRLQRHADFEAALADYVGGEDGFLPPDLLKSGDRPLLLLLDGLDELVLGSGLNDPAPKYLMEQVRRHLDRAQHGSTPIRAIAFGRPQAMLDLNRIYPDKMIELLPLAIPPRASLRYARWDGVDAGMLPERAEEDQRERLWTGFWQATGLPRTGLPSELAGEAHAELTAEPILNMLLAVRYYQELPHNPDYRAPERRADLYFELINRIYERSWGSGNTPHPTHAMGPEVFWAMLRKIGVALWHAGDRLINFDILTRYLERDAGAAFPPVESAWSPRGERPRRLIDGLEAFRGGLTEKRGELLASFYFRLEQNQQHHGCFEFTHKSFGEYLAAQALLDEIERLSRGTGQNPGAELLVWVALAGPAPLTDMIDFLQGECERRYESKPEQVARLLDCVEYYWHWMLVHGAPVHRLISADPKQALLYDEAYEDFVTLDEHARNASEALVTLGAALAWTQRPVQGAGAARRFKFCPDKGAGKDSDRVRERVGEVLADWSRQSTRRHWLRYLPMVDLRGAWLIGADLTGAYLERTDLEGAYLTGANLERADLTRANSRGANLTDANLTRANFRGANLRGADLTRADLRGADLTRADFTGADLTGADLTAADLTRADLTAAYLTGADLTAAYLTAADLTRADLRGADLTRADLTDSVGL